MWTQRTPDAGNPARIRHLASDRNQLADRLETDAVRALRRVAGAASDGGWVGEAASAFFSQVERLAEEFAPLLARLRADAAALIGYAGELEGLAEDASILRGRERAVEMQLEQATRMLALESNGAATPDQLQSTKRGARDERAQLSHLDAEWEELARRRTAADARCAAAITPPPPPVVGTLNAHQLSALSDGQLLAALGALTPTQLVELLRHDDALSARISQLEDSREVAAWWGSLGDPAHPENASGAQLALVALQPAMLGNLEGVAYWARDEANRTVLAGRQSALKQLRSDIRSALSKGDDARAAQLLKQAGFASTADLDVKLDSLRAVKVALGRAGSVPYQLVALDLRSGSQTPLAAISVGDLDRADLVTVAVPGVDTTVANSMSKWTETSRNLWVAEGHMGTSRVAVVSWIGYDNPPLEVGSDTNARAGARSLAAFLEGVSASHDWVPGSNLALVGHSYGATTAAFATELTPVAHLTMLASVGVDPSTQQATFSCLPAMSGPAAMQETTRPTSAGPGPSGGISRSPAWVRIIRSM